MQCFEQNTKYISRRYLQDTTVHDFSSSPLTKPRMQYGGDLCSTIGSPQKKILGPRARALFIRNVLVV